MIRLDPETLPNPDADLRYLVPDALAASCEGVSDDGYDYDEGGILSLFLAVRDRSAAEAVVAALRDLELLGNRFDRAPIGWADGDHEVDPERYAPLLP